MDSVCYRSSATTRHFKKIAAVAFIFTGTNFWFEDACLPKVLVRYIKSIWKFLDIMIIAQVLTMIGALYTQDLTKKQVIDVITKTTLNYYISVICGGTFYYKEGIKELIVTLTVTLKEMFNDEKVERMMIWKNYLFQFVLMLLTCAPTIAYGVNAAIHSLTSNATFITVITIWPDLEDRSLVAGVARVIIYIVWSLLAIHFFCIYSIIITVSICLGHQYTNLCEYFLSLNDIFKGEESIEDQELKYEDAVKDGIKIHCITLNCVNQLQTTCQVAFSGQSFIMICGVVLLMIQMMEAERTLVNLAPIALMAAGTLVCSGLVICSVADITFEAERLPTAIFHSGWHNCRGKSSVRMRKTITIAMAAAQRPVVITGMKIIELSYESYVAIVKAAYSVFSVFY